MTRFARLLVWTPRVLGMMCAVFLGLFALDAFRPDGSISDALPDFVVHLAPSFVVIAVIALSWRRPWIGGLAFAGLAAAYVALAGARLDWILVISGPLLVVAVLFFLSWRVHPGGTRSSA